MDAIDTPVLSAANQPSVSGSRALLRRLSRFCLQAWEISFVIAFATFLRFYHLSLTEFDTDQAVLWNMARGALVHGLIPATSNIASIGIDNPPGFIYLLMIVAAFTANPLLGAVLTAFLNVVGVVLTYVFTRRYYGRLAAIIASSLCAISMAMILYSRFIWQPNLLLPLIVLYLLALYVGAVEQRTGWFACAFPLLGLMIQLSGSSIYLAAPLAMALLLGYTKVRWRDIAIGLFLFACMYRTYALWEASNNFADLSSLLGTTSGHAVIDTQAIMDYARFVAPPILPANSPYLLSTHLISLLHWDERIIYVALLASFLLLLLGLVWQRVQLVTHQKDEQIEGGSLKKFEGAWQGLWGRWQRFVDSPQRRGILILLAWQLVPVLFLTRHSISLQVHYFLVFMPGPFILLGLLVSQLTRWSASIKDLGRWWRPLFPTLALLLIALQAFGSLVWLLDSTSNQQRNSTNYNTLQDLQAAVNAADQLAQTNHLHRVYIDTNVRTVEALTYLAGQMHTPHTLLTTNNAHCLLLPGQTQGPSVMLFGPAEPLDEALVRQFTSAQLIKASARLGGAPFHLYIVQPLQAISSQTSFVHTLALAQKQPGTFLWQNTHSTSRFFATLWTALGNQSAAAGTAYTDHFNANYLGKGTDSSGQSTNCGFTSIAAGEQLLVPFVLPAAQMAQTTGFSIRGQSSIKEPEIVNYGPFRLQTIQDRSSVLNSFHTTSGAVSIVVET